jgi:hypothetical protein
MDRIEFTYDYLKSELQSLLSNKYQFMNCLQYYEFKKLSSLNSKIVVLRVDVDLSVKKAEILLDIFNSLGIKASFFIRLHAPEYNPFSFENYRIIKKIIETGHEIGYHSEIVDAAHIWKENAKDCLLRDIKVINSMFNISIKGITSHGGMTGLNNLSFWENHKALEFGLLYEGYDKEDGFNIFQEAFYISDSEWVRWKCYNKGQKVDNDHRSPSKHISDNHNLIHLLIHPDTYYVNHFYE